MKELSEYWEEIKFKYLKTYSGLRGEKFETLEEEVKKQVNQLEEELRTARFMKKPKINAEINLIQKELNVHSSRIIDKSGGFHKSTIEISRKEKSDAFIKNLNSILNKKCETEVAAGCSPIFRDAIVFYSDKNEINGILQVCFECAAIRNENEESLRADYQTYVKLANLLKEIGHQIEIK